MAGKRSNPKAAAVDKALRGLFQDLEGRPVPDRLRLVADQLDEGETRAEPPKAAQRGH